MDQETKYIVYDGIIVPAAARLQQKRRDRYGHIKDLPDDELVDPDELERLVYQQEFGPVWALPFTPSKCVIKPTIDEDGKPNWGAFGTVDFFRYKPKFDPLTRIMNELEEQREHLLIMIGIMRERMKDKVDYEVINYVLKGIVDVDEIYDWDTWQLAKLSLRAVRFKKRIKKLREKRRENNKEDAEALWN